MSSARVLVDSSVLVSLIDSHDKWHASSRALVQALGGLDIELLYPDCVVNETITVLARRCREQGRGSAFARLLDALECHVPNASITWVSKQTQMLYADVLGIVRNSGGALNFHDALIAAYCGMAGIAYVASFDQDFDLLDPIRRLSTPDDVVALTTPPTRPM
jgi:predicted nucleic acid-binding protein